jgi:hypothetical protein
MSSPQSPSALGVRVVLSHRVRNADGGWHWQVYARAHTTPSCIAAAAAAVGSYLTTLPRNLRACLI